MLTPAGVPEVETEAVVAPERVEAALRKSKWRQRQNSAAAGGRKTYVPVLLLLLLLLVRFVLVLACVVASALFWPRERRKDRNGQRK
jgi:hypothetical protein